MPKMLQSDKKLSKVI